MPRTRDAFADRAQPVQLVNLRLVIAGVTAPPDFPPEPLVKGDPVPEKLVEVFHDGARRRMPLYLREALHHGHRFAGPAVVAQEDATTCIPAGFTARCDAHGNLHLEAA